MKDTFRKIKKLFFLLMKDDNKLLYLIKYKNPFRITE